MLLRWKLCTVDIVITDLQTGALWHNGTDMQMGVMRQWYWLTDGCTVTQWYWHADGCNETQRNWQTPWLLTNYTREQSHVSVIDDFTKMPGTPHPWRFIQQCIYNSVMYLAQHLENYLNYRTSVFLRSALFVLFLFRNVAFFYHNLYDLAFG